MSNPTDATVTQWGKARSVASFRALSMLGSEMTVFALVLRERSHGATFVSVLMACGTVSLVVMVPLAGWISDRFTTRQIIPFTSLLQSALIFSLIYQHNLILLTITIFLSSSCGAVENPALMALIPTLVKKEDYSKQMGFAQTLYAFASLFAPALGGILVSQTGYKTPFICDSLSFIVLASAPALLKVNRVPIAAGGSTKVKATEGLKYIFKNRYLRSLAVLIAAFLFAAGTIQIGNLFLLTKILHTSVLIYGLSGAAFALGMIVGGIALMQVKIKESQQARLVVLVLVVTSFLIMGMSVAGHWSIVVILDIFAGLMISVLTNLISTIFIQRSPGQMRGRIGAALNAFINTGMIGALLISGPILDWLGARKLLAVAGVAALLLIGNIGLGGFISFGFRSFSRRCRIFCALLCRWLLVDQSKILGINQSGTQKHKANA